MELAGKHIFIVEDNSSNSTIMKIILEARGAKVYRDQWCINTIARIKEVPHIDLVIMDLMLPGGVTGYDIFDQLKADEGLQPIPVLIVSASDPSLEMNRARRKGFQGYLSKPIDPYGFARSVTAVLAGHEVWADE